MKLNLFINRNFLFKSDFNKVLSVFIYIIDYIIDNIFIQNDFDINVVILQNVQIGFVIKYEINKCFMVSPDYSELISKLLLK